MKVDAVIVAAGSSARFGDEDKLFVDLCGRPLLAWPLAAYEAAESVDRIIVVERGTIVEEGGHDTLMRRGGVYAGLYEAQFKI